MLLSEKRASSTPLWRAGCRTARIAIASFDRTVDVHKSTRKCAARERCRAGHRNADCRCLWVVIFGGFCFPLCVSVQDIDHFIQQNSWHGVLNLGTGKFFMGLESSRKCRAELCIEVCLPACSPLPLPDVAQTWPKLPWEAGSHPARNRCPRR